MQALELVILAAGGAADDGRGGEGVVGGELRIEPFRGEKLVGAGEEIQVGHYFPRKHRIIGEAALLRPLDLAVPISALDQPHHEAAIEPLSQGGDMGDRRGRPLLVGLRRQAETVPTAQGGIGDDVADHVQRQLEPVGLLRVHGQAEIFPLASLASSSSRGASSAMTRSAEIAS